MAAKTSLTRDDILPLDVYAADRREHRRRLAEIKKPRRIEVGPFVTFYFENYDTMWHQVHEMLHIERGGEAQIADELAAYNPLIPNGDELIATVMIEIGDPVRRNRELHKLGGIEDHMYLSFDAERIRGVADPTRENTSPEGKASAVQFLRFPFTPAQKQTFKMAGRMAGTRVVITIDHPNYGHMAVMPETVRTALAGDLA